MEGVVKKIDEKYRKRIMTLTVGNQVQNQIKSLTNQKRLEDYRLDVPPNADSSERLPARGERGSTISYTGQQMSQIATPNSNMSVSINKSSGAHASRKDPRKLQETVLQPNNQSIAIRNSIIQKIKKRTSSKKSSLSDNSSFSKEQSAARGGNKQPLKTNGNPKEGLQRQIEERVLHLTLNGAKHNTNLVQINNYINKAGLRDDINSVEASDNKSHKNSTSSNNSDLKSINLKNIKKAVSTAQKETKGLTLEATRLKPEIQAGARQIGRSQFTNQTLLSNIQNKNVLTLTQKLLQKRYKNE